MSFEEKLIEAVKENEVLYNMKCKNYRRVDIKDKMWSEIANKLGSTSKYLKKQNLLSDKCRTRWKGLRDTYKGIKKQQEMPSGSAAKNIKKWKYFELLKFLDDFDCSRKTTTSFSSNEADCEMPWQDDELFLSSINEPAQESTPEPSSNKRKRIPSEVEDTVKKKFQELLTTVQEEIASSSTKNSTVKLFEVLAMKVVEAKLPQAVVAEIERDVSQLVYDKIAMYSE